MNIFFIILFLFSVSLFSSDVKNPEKTFSVAIESNEQNVVLLDRLLASRVIKEVDMRTDGSTALIFDQDIGEKIQSFRAKRTRELIFLKREQGIIGSLLLEPKNPFPTTDYQKNVILVEAQKHYIDIIPQREKEEKLSFLEFLSLYSDDRAKLLEDMKDTNNRVS